MSDLLGMLLTPAPRCMYCNAPATVIDDPFALCSPCEAALIDDLKQSGFPVTSSLRENATADVSPASLAVATISSSCGDVEGHVRKPIMTGVEAKAVDAISTGRAVPQGARPIHAAGIESGPQDSIDLDIPEYLKRSRDNVPAFARLSGDNSSSVSVEA